MRCAEAGVFAPLVGVIGAMQAMEALKYLAQVGELLIGRLLLWDGLQRRRPRAESAARSGLPGVRAGRASGGMNVQQAR